MTTSTARLLVLVAMLVATGTRAGAACKSTCTDELRACRAQCRDAADRRDCRRRCAEASTCATPGAPKVTGAYPLNECRNDAGGFALHERLVVRRGNCDAVTVMELPAVGPVPDPYSGAIYPGVVGPLAGTCDLFGRFRTGFGSVIFGRFQRIAVTHDAKYVVVEVTNDHVFPGLEPLSPEPPEEGIFLVSTDDGRRQSLGPPSKRHIIERGPRGGFLLTGSPFFAISPDSRFVAFEERGPGPDGQDADQIAVIDLETRERRLVTQLPQAAQGAQRTNNPVFVDDRTILFFNGFEGRRSTVGVDGQNLKTVPDPSITGGNVVLDFGVIGARGNAIVGRVLDETPIVDYPRGDAPPPPVREIFFVEGSRLLQLTGFRYPDTGGGARPQLVAGRAVFIASADPLGHRDRRGGNPDSVCQLFSIDTLAGRLRQITHFPADAGEQRGCGVPGPDVACQVTGFGVEPTTGGILFVSSCDPLGRNPSGEQAFTIRADGTGLRQISAFRGREAVDGVVQVEMAGPPASSLVIR